MAESFFFYDLETSGFNPRDARIMQFAGQRTDMKLQPIGDPVNTYIKLTPDILPDPSAIMVTNITPQRTLDSGVTEADFLSIFSLEVATPGTIFVGFNSVRFDDGFMRFIHYRNFYDPYEWQWQDNRSRWDLLDVVRMTRALRPDGIEWPFAPDGRPSNRLELLTSINNLNHTNAHDALSDVNATIAVAKLIKDKQPKLFEFLLNHRDKKQVASIVEAGQPIIYTSGKYSADFEKTTVVNALIKHPTKQAMLMYDLRHDPAEFLNMSPRELAVRWQWTKDESAPKRLPVKTLQYNRCPAVAPLSVLDDSSKKRLKLDLATINRNLAILRKTSDFSQNILAALAILDKQQQTNFLSNEQDVDAQLYDDFISESDRKLERVVRAVEPEAIMEAGSNFHDDRLKKLLPLYKARNFPTSLDADERLAWDKFCQRRLLGNGKYSRLAKYFNEIQVLSENSRLDSQEHFILEELKLYGESIMPVDPLA